MVDAGVIQSFLVRFMPIFKWGAISLVGLGILFVGFYWLFVIRRRRKWKIEVLEQKSDGALHTVGYDTLVERKLKMGTKTIYWLQKAKQEALPPPSDVTDRFNGKEEVDYIRIDRELIPAEKKMRTNYNDPKVLKRVIPVYDKLLKTIRETKTTLFSSKPLEDKFIFIPIDKVLTAKEDVKPIPYDMNMMAANEINNADEFFQMKYEWWKKYGAIIVFATTIVFLIVLIVLSFDYVLGLQQITMQKIGENTDMLGKLVEGIGGNAKPPS